jgi:RNA polymerase sigma-70 factor
METESTCPCCQRVIPDKQRICPECQASVSAGKKLDETLSDQLEPVLSQYSSSPYKEAQSAFPGVQLEFPVFIRRVAEVLKQYVPAPWIDSKSTRKELAECALQFLEKLKWKELYLTTACANGSEPAWLVFQSRYTDCVLKAAYGCSESASAAHELADTLMGDLFLPTGSKRTSTNSKIAQYQGIGSLEGWLRVIITRMRIDQARASRKQVPIDDQDLEPHLPPANSTTSRLVETKERHIAVSAVTQSLESAFRQLNDEDRLVVELYYLRQVNLKNLARLLKVHESTASRRVKQICRKLQKLVERHLIDKFKVRPQEIQEFIRTALSENEVELRKMFAESAQQSRRFPSIRRGIP